MMSISRLLLARVLQREARLKIVWLYGVWQMESRNLWQSVYV